MHTMAADVFFICTKIYRFFYLDHITAVISYALCRNIARQSFITHDLIVNIIKALKIRKPIKEQNGIDRLAF